MRTLDWAHVRVAVCGAGRWNRSFSFKQVKAWKEYRLRSHWLMSETDWERSFYRRLLLSFRTLILVAWPSPHPQQRDHSVERPQNNSLKSRARIRQAGDWDAQKSHVYEKGWGGSLTVTRTAQRKMEIKTPTFSVIVSVFMENMV